MDQVAEVKSKVDIVSIIRSRVDLKPAGKNMKGLCPFHAEKSPSFFVSPEMQTFKCFGCGEGGDVYSFLQKYEGIGFREALEDLAERVGVKLESYEPSKGEVETSKVYEVLSLAREYYAYILNEHKAGAPGREYLSGREVGQNLIKEFSLGMSGSSWDGLYKYLVGKKRYGVEIVEKAGLILKGRKGGYYDRFRGRVMFPLMDFRGRVVGFSGRLLDGEAKEAKYINTPETVVYHKRELLYGLGSAKQAIRKKGKVIVVEGEFDVISSWGAGVRNVVAIKGSALTEEQVRLLMRLTRVVVLCLDADSAGDAAMKRGIEVADKLGMDVEVVMVKGGKDPDEIARSSPAEWKKTVEKSVSVYDFYMESALSRHNLESGQGKKKVVEELAPVLAKISNSVERDHYVGKLASALKVREEVVLEEVEREGRREKVGGVARQRGEALRPGSGQAEKEAEEVEGRVGLLEKYVWGLVLNLPEDKVEEGLMSIEGLNWANPGLAKVAVELEEWVAKKRGFELKAFVASLPSELSRLVGGVYMSEKVMGLDDDDKMQELKRSVEDLDKLQTKARLKELGDEIARHEDGGGSGKKLTKLQREYSELLLKL